MDPVRLRSARGAESRGDRVRRWGYSAALLALVALFCAGTRWGGTFPTFARKTAIVWHAGRSLSEEQRRIEMYDETFPILLYLRETTPRDAVILLPPWRLINERTQGEPPLLASPSSVYNFIHPRVPVHWGDPSPWKGRITHVLVWDYWGLDLAAPDVPRTEENRIRVFPLDVEGRALW